MRHVNITSGATTTTLIDNSGYYDGNVSKVLISNNDSIDSTIDILIHDNVNTIDYFVVKNLVIPAGVSLVLEDCLTFDINNSSLKINHSDPTNLSIIIK